MCAPGWTDLCVGEPLLFKGEDFVLTDVGRVAN